ncbi:MAG: metallophosphoesterase, partial [Pontibacter sp.]|nr:metallophosphoesterase [Pontibacter sp.]
MLLYFLIIVIVLLLTFMVFSYWQELKYRRKPFYKLSDVAWQRYEPPQGAGLLQSVALLGDVGAVATDGTDPVLKLVKQWESEVDAKGTM